MNEQTSATATGPEEEAPLKGRPAWLVWLNRLGPLLALLVVYGFFAIQVPAMLRGGAIEAIVSQAVLVGTAAVGMTLVIVSAGIDLSVGSVIALSSVVVAQLLTGAGLSPVPAVAGGLAAGALCGLANGLMTVLFRVTPFIVTLGTMQVYRGLAKWMADSRPVDVMAHTEGQTAPLTGLMAKLSPQLAWLPPIGGWVMIGLAVVTALLLGYTRFGRHTVAVGSNEHTARLCGVHTVAVKLTVYALAGAAAGLSGVMLVSTQSQGDPTAGIGMELDVIAAVVIGGGSLDGGQGSAIGSLIGALIMSVIKVGCTFMGLDPWVQDVVTGSVIVLAVALDRFRHRRAEA